MDSLYRDLYYGKYYSNSCSNSNDPQIRYGQLVGLTFYVWGRPRVRFRRRVGL